MKRILPLLTLAALPATARAADSGLGSSLLQTLLGLVAVLLVIGAAAWMLRRIGPLQAGANGAMRVLGGLSMGARERVVLIQVGQTQLLLGVAPGRVQTLHVLDPPLPLAKIPAPAAAPFAERLARLMKGERSR